MTYWEIKLLILGFVSRQHAHNEESVDKTGLALYATVCKEWQSVFEKINFSRLILHPLCLPGFKSLISDRKQYVKRLRFRINLQKYDLSAREVETITKVENNNLIIRKALRELFTILSAWNETTMRNSEMLLLELSAYSNEEIDEYKQQGWYEPRYGLLNGLQRLTLPSSLFGTRTLLKLQQLPKVNVVTGLTIRRQVCRQFTSNNVHLLLTSLPKLEYLHYETDQEDIWKIEELVDSGYRDIFSSNILGNMKRLSLYEDPDPYLSNLAPGFLTHDAPYVRLVEHSLGPALAKNSLAFEQLSVSFLVEAQDFLEAFKSNWTWDKLVSISLTSRLLQSFKNEAKINDMLMKAGIAARSMPKLQIMEIWYGGRQEAAIFRYCIDSEVSMLSWESTWDLKLCADVIEIWEDVASGHSRHQLTINKVLISKENIVSHGTVISSLMLKQQVLHPQSLQEIKRVEELCKYVYRHYRLTL